MPVGPTLARAGGPLHGGIIYKSSIASVTLCRCAMPNAFEDGVKGPSATISTVGLDNRFVSTASAPLQIADARIDAAKSLKGP